MSELKTGLITSVYTQKGNVLCDVQMFRTNSVHEKVIIPSRFRGETVIPKEADKVTIQKTDRGFWILRDVLSVDVEMLSDVETEKSGYILRFDDNTAIEIKENEDGTHDLVLSASGDVKIKEGSNDAETAVAVQGHDHDFEYQGGGDGSSTLTGTTKNPNQAGTDTEIE